jgi:hypothetical protein
MKSMPAERGQPWRNLYPAKANVEVAERALTGACARPGLCHEPIGTGDIGQDGQEGQEGHSPLSGFICILHMILVFCPRASAHVTQAGRMTLNFRSMCKGDWLAAGM